MRTETRNTRDELSLGNPDEKVNEKCGGCEKKANRPPFFAARDTFIYAFVIVLVFVLFLCFVILPKKSEAKGFLITIDGKEAFSLEYSRPESYSLSPEFSEFIEVSLSENTVTIKGFSEENAVNVLTFDREKRTVKMTYSNCSHSSPCVSFPAISGSGSIICAPRKIVVKPTGGKFSPSSPSTGYLVSGRLCI